jgi:two-component system, chemotaxis family, response regulator Rcp1
MRRVLRRGIVFLWERYTVSRSFLYVEDDDAAFLLLEIVLQEADPGIELFRASDGEQALAFLQKSQPYANAPDPDLIILDVNLPKRDGFDVLRALKGSESFSAIPVIMFTTSANISEREKSLALGADEYVTKPRNLDRLLDVVRGFASHRQGGAKGTGRAAP